MSGTTAASCSGVMRGRVLALVLSALCAAGCYEANPVDMFPDSGADAGTDAGIDAGTDAGTDAATDTESH
jgi:endoglucanase